ncbi:hypothetical protein K1719_009946 [Acacia pycnantha]|nr:hypothetical protein K1719_009946 [Acacia pycnantha]
MKKQRGVVSSVLGGSYEVIGQKYPAKPSYTEITGFAANFLVSLSKFSRDHYLFWPSTDYPVFWDVKRMFPRGNLACI